MPESPDESELSEGDCDMFITCLCFTVTKQCTAMYLRTLTSWRYQRVTEYWSWSNVMMAGLWAHLRKPTRSEPSQETMYSHCGGYMYLNRSEMCGS